jgi:CO/xanthine dehydrogenase FAD-binding subunit
LEERLAGLPASVAARQAGDWLSAPDAQAFLAPLSPIDDVRGTAGYRLDAVRELIPRALAMACDVSASIRESAR